MDFGVGPADSILIRLLGFMPTPSCVTGVLPSLRSSTQSALSSVLHSDRTLDLLPLVKEKPLQGSL